MKLFKLIEIDMVAERNRINYKGRYNAHQRKALLDLCELFEAGEWQKCLDHVNNKKAFPYNKKGEYPEQEHICTAMGTIIWHLGHTNYFTQEQLLKEAQEKINKTK